MKLFGVQAQQSAFSREYSGPAGNPRAFAHTMADEIHKQQRGLDGVARTKLTFSSDRDKEKISGTVENREVKEVYISDYDGENQRRITVNRVLNITPKWSPDGRSIAYTSYARGFPTIFISLIYEGRQDRAVHAGHAELAAGLVAGRHEDPVHLEPRRQPRAVRDEPRRLERAPADEQPGDRHDADLVAQRQPDRVHVRPLRFAGHLRDGCRRAQPPPYLQRGLLRPRDVEQLVGVQRNRLRLRNRGGYDIKVYDLASGEIRQITNGEGSNESPAFAPNGRHIAFTSTRAGGRTQVFVISRDGKDVRQITRAGNNYTPDWSR